MTVNMQLFILTCINEEGVIVSLDVHMSMHEAHWAMVDSHNKEVEEFKRSGHYSDTFDYMDQNSATAGDDEMHYRWKIYIREI